MRATKRTSRKPKPLAEVRSPVRIRAYRAKFRPFEATRYLDVRALKRAKKARIECGTVDVAGKTITLEAEVRSGRVVALRPIGCDACAPGKAQKLGSPALKTAMRAMVRQLEQRGVRPQGKPMPLRISARRGFQFPIGPIIIVIGDWDFCVEIWIGNELCWWCLFGPSGCIEFGPPF